MHSRDSFTKRLGSHEEIEILLSATIIQWKLNTDLLVWTKKNGNKQYLW